MHILDLISLSFKSLKSRKSRIIFTILSVALGIAAILFLVSMGFGLQKTLLDKITTAESLLTLDAAPAQEELIAINQDIIEEIKANPAIDKISPHGVLPSQISLGEITSEATLNLIEADWFPLSGTLPTLGRAFSVEDRQKIVINSSIAELFGLEASDMIGESLGLKIFLQRADSSEVEIYETGQKFKVVGVFEETGAAPQIYLRFGDLADFEITEYQFAKVKVKQSKDLESVREELIGMGFLVSALSDTIDQANKIFTIIQIVLGVFGVLALVVAAIGLINTMTITLLQRTNEIGIMRAIGASPKDIQRLFLGESVMTGFLGGLTGIVIGFTASQIFNFLINILANALGGQAVSLFYFPIWFVLFILFLSSIVGLIAGFWPARRASKLNPLEALRYK